jgi:ribonucleotide reductase beta subunit family protein with ferritin-like domain
MSNELEREFTYPGKELKEIEKTEELTRLEKFLYDSNASSLYMDDVIDFKHEPMFLGTGKNTQRFDDPKYAFFDKSNDKQQGNDWKHNEVPLVQDQADFKTSLTDAQRFITRVDHQKLIFLDSIQGRGPLLIFGQITTLPELENVILTWEYFEGAKHSRTYTEHLRAFYDKPDEVFDEAFQLPELKKLAKKIGVVYDIAYYNVINYVYKDQRGLEYTQQEYKDLKESIVMLWVEINILEGIRFYPGFASIWGMTESKNIFRGVSENLQFICMHPETDILTDKGWKKVEFLSLDDNIAQQDLDTGLVSFAKPTRKIWREYKGKMHKIIDATGKTIQHLTEDHEIVVSRRNSKTKELTTKKVKVQDTKFNNSTYYPQGGKLEISNDEFALNTLEQFRIMTAADGYINPRSNGKQTGFQAVNFSLKKERKIELFFQYCNELDYKIVETKSINDVRMFIVSVPVEINISKSLNWICLNSSTDYIDSILMELIKWDGSDKTEASNNKYAFFTSDKEVADQVIALITLSSYKSFNYKQVNKSQGHYKDSYKIYFRDDEKIINTQKYIDDVYDYDGMIGCVTMPKGTIITKSVDNKVTTTGNCRDENEHLALTQFMLKLLKKEKEEGFVEVYKELEPRIEARFYEAYHEECDWIDFKFSKGSYTGMNAAIQKMYLNYITIRRMRAVGLNPTKERLGDMYIIKNPIPWVDKFINMDKNEKLPQEEKVLNYITGAVEQDVAKHSELACVKRLLKQFIK